MPPANSSIACRPGRNRRAGSVWTPRQTPYVGVAYHVYSNTGAGDPINYTSPIATIPIMTTSFTTGTLKYPGTWSFGIRAFDLVSGLEEQNLEVATTIILNAAGVDVTNMPGPPLALRAFALAGGAIRVEWAYAAPGNSAKLPTGFHVYLGPVAGPMAPVSSVKSGAGRRDWSGSVWVARGVASPGKSAPRGPGRSNWSCANGAAPDYSSIVATVAYNAAILNTFVANIPALNSGTTYAVGVRAYNASAEEANTNVVNVTADSTGPAAVDSLTAAAV
jgi:hypothetical protein